MRKKFSSSPARAAIGVVACAASLFAYGCSTISNTNEVPVPLPDLMDSPDGDVGSASDNTNEVSITPPTPRGPLPEKVIDYVVKKGDSLWKISRTYDTTVGAIKTVNGMSDDVIKYGQTIKVPQGSKVVGTPSTPSTPTVRDPEPPTTPTSPSIPVPPTTPDPDPEPPTTPDPPTIPVPPTTPDPEPPTIPGPTPTTPGGPDIPTPPAPTPDPPGGPVIPPTPGGGPIPGTSSIIPPTTPDEEPPSVPVTTEPDEETEVVDTPSVPSVPTVPLPLPPEPELTEPVDSDDVAIPVSDPDEVELPLPSEPAILPSISLTPGTS